jgi:hypothetical protein
VTTYALSLDPPTVLSTEMGAEGVDWERLLSEYLMIFQKAVIKNVRFRAHS